MKRLVIVGALLLGACSSSSKVSNELTQAPEWYIEPPVEKQNIYVSGYGRDTNLQFAIEVSELSAKRTLASHISSVVSGKSRYYRGANGKNLSEIAAIEIIEEVNLAGYKREKVEIKEKDGNYSVYILLIYPLSNLSQEPQIFEDIEQ